MMPRFLARLVAEVGGYFWLPCPACGKHFGGQEWRRVNGHADSIPDPDRETGYSLGICPACTAAGRGCAAHAEVSGLPWHGCDPERDALTDEQARANVAYMFGWRPADGDMPEGTPET